MTAAERAAREVWLSDRKIGLQEHEMADIIAREYAELEQAVDRYTTQTSCAFGRVACKCWNCKLRSALAKVRGA